MRPPSPCGQPARTSNRRLSAGAIAVRAAFPAVLAAMAGCRPSPPPAPEPLTSTAQRGPITFTVEVSPRQVWIADPITVRLTATAPDDTAVSLPEASALGDLTIRSWGAVEERPTPGGGRTWRQTIVLESLVSGTVDVPPLVLKYGRRAEGVDAPEWDNELATDTLRVEVRSALTSQDSPTAPRDITGTIAAPREPWRWWHVAALVASSLAVAGLGYAVYWLVRRRLLRPPPPIDPEVWALRELAALASRDWTAADESREYYYRLTEIVRHYIERKFHLAAPEMTTEEFLTALARDSAALPYDAVRLRGFLESCDLVKYAALRPNREDAENALSTARAFIHATAAAAESARVARANSIASGNRDGVGDRAA